MSNEQSNFDRGKAQLNRGDGLLVSDVIQYMSSLARLHSRDKFGNPALSRGLRDLARALRPYMDCPASELAEIISSKETPKTAAPKAVSRRVTPEQLPEFRSMSQEEVERILEDEGVAKKVLAELGFQRFGISRSMLEHQNKRDAIDSVRSALENEKTLEAISRQARKAGMARTA